MPLPVTVHICHRRFCLNYLKNIISILDAQYLQWYIYYRVNLFPLSLFP